MAEADIASIADGDLEGIKTRNRKTMTFDEMMAHTRTDGDLFAEFRDSSSGQVAYEYARREDYEARTVEHHAQMGVSRDFLSEKANLDYLIGFAMIGRATSFLHQDFVQLLDHNMIQIFDMGAAQIWAMWNDEYLDPMRQGQQAAA